MQTIRLRHDPTIIFKTGYKIAIGLYSSVFYLNFIKLRLQFFSYPTQSNTR